MNEGAPNGRDLSWGVERTALHRALMEGRMLDARRLMAQGHRPGEETLTLAFKQDRMATHALLREAGLEPALIPGSSLGTALEAAQADDLADAFVLRMLEQGQIPSEEDDTACTPRARL